MKDEKIIRLIQGDLDVIDFADITDKKDYIEFVTGWGVHFNRVQKIFLSLKSMKKMLIIKHLRQYCDVPEQKTRQLIREHFPDL